MCWVPCVRRMQRLFLPRNRDPDRPNQSTHPVKERFPEWYSLRHQTSRHQVSLIRPTCSCLTESYLYNWFFQRTTDIENIEIIADPQDALKMLQPKASQIEHTPSFNKLTDETNRLAAQPQQQQTTSSLLKPNDNNNNHINGNKNGSNQSLKVSKHVKTSNNNNQNSHNKSNSNISPASASPPYYQQNDSNKRKTYSHANSGRHFVNRKEIKNLASFSLLL